MSDVSEYVQVKSEDISEYLRKKGSLKILMELSQEPKSFKHLQDTLSHSPNTILERLREAQDLGLVEETVEGRGRERRIKYICTNTGLGVLNQSTSLQKYKDLEEEVRKLKEKMKEKEKQMEDIRLETGQKIKEVKIGEIEISQGPGSKAEVMTQKKNSSDKS
ncbi:hypothetical protein AKJ57_04090 [candidate division MSBL1 archaeon SCGC-AAA259A05]|uniref:HTH hxlR-type domain-containing protein n=1 Tax=candidate division MSBL1 archaeon SCGC-AAA259A05 TaxID=1698259 RepID=A0A133U8J7_9EURY|nr:hypothetical protein AKJ57_04090 [candidate division MSBL1 archaeon SCGC-AAA259A05]